MTDNEQGGAVISESSAEDIKKEDVSKKTPDERVVKFDDHKRALDDMHKYKSKVRELETKLGSLESDRLREKEDYKTLAERAAAERDDYRSKYEKLNDSFIHNRKYDSIHAAALKSGLLSEAENDLELLDLSPVEIEATSSGRLLVHGADVFVDELKKRKPHWFKPEGTAKINRGGANAKPSEPERLTPQKYVELERKYRREGKINKIRELNEKYLSQRKQ